MADLVPASDLPDSVSASKLVPTEDLPEAAVSASKAVPADDMPDMDSPTNKYGTPGQQLLTAVEGAGQGIAGPLATGVELGAHKLGLDEMAGIDTSAEAQVGRQQENPMIHGIAQGTALAGSMMTGIGEAGLLASGTKALLPEATTVLSKLGSAAISNGIQMGMIQAGDELSKSMLGQGDPETPVVSALVRIGGAGLLSAGTGALFNGIGQAGAKGLEAIENAKIGNKASDTLIAMGVAAKAHAAGVPESEAPAWVADFFGGPENFNYSRYSPGVKLYYSGVKTGVTKATDGVVDLIAGSAGFHTLGPVGGAVAMGMTHKYVTPVVEKILNKPLVGITNKIAIPTIMYALSKGQTSGLFTALNYATQASKGQKLITLGVDSILKAGTQQVFDSATEKQKKTINDYLDNGGLDSDMESQLQSDKQPDGFADGGIVPPEQGSINSLYPDQDMMLNAAKGRVANYLKSVKPMPNPAKLPFDIAPDTRIQDRSYDMALDIAAAPLSLLNHVKDGSIQIEQVKHFTSLYPELHQYLSKRLTQGIMEANMRGEKPPYKTRMALSMFMGVALDDTMTPGSIMAAQTAYAKQPNDAPVKTDKGSPAKLGKTEKGYKTASQSAESDRIARD